MIENFCSDISRRMISAIVAIVIYNHASASPPENPAEKNKIYEFASKDMKDYGTQINADISRIGYLFGMTSNLNLSRPPLKAEEEQGWLGIAMQLPAKPPKDPYSGTTLQAIGVAAVMPESAASAAGLREGDLITSIDDAPIDSDDTQKQTAFRMAITKKHPGETVKLHVLRNEELYEVDALLKAYPRVDSVTKPHADLEKKLSVYSRSLLNEVLEKNDLTDKLTRLIKQFRNETDKVDSLLIRSDEYNPFRLQEVNYALYNPLALPVIARKLTDRMHKDFNREHQNIELLLSAAMDELDIAYTPAGTNTNNSPRNLTDYIERLVNAIQHANAERTAILSALDDEEIELLYTTAPKLLARNPDAEQKPKTYAEIKEDEDRLFRFFQTALKLDIPRLLKASAQIGRALDLNTLKKLGGKIGTLEHYPENWVVKDEGNLTVIDTMAGRVLIGGTQDNKYSEDAALILDLGGNDNYLNHAGGNTRLVPFSVVIDLSGDDVYFSTDNFSQGAALLGSGFLVDLEGNDRYTAKNHSQGTGILGVGILADLSGKDQYTSVSVSQGVGSFGIGLLTDGSGDDNYFANYFSQGAGYIKGLGAIVEVEGNDNYFSGGLYEDFREPEKSFQSMSQGFGFGLRPLGTLVASGGIGIIADAEGNDTYVADYFSQGSSYWYSLGILDDRKGHDRYISGRYSQGAGIHMSAGVLIDGEGNDNYLADFGVAQGCGHDYGIGFLLDNGGNDRYVSGINAQGAGNDSGIGVLSDNGGIDKYFANSLSQGNGNFDAVRESDSFGFLFDTGGSEDIYNQGGKNNALMYKNGQGILVDTN